MVMPVIPQSEVRTKFLHETGEQCGEHVSSLCRFSSFYLGNPNGGLAKGGLARKGPIGPKRALSGQFLLPPWLWGAEELVPIGPEKAPTSPEMAGVCPEKARFSRKDFPPIFSENLGLKPPFVSPPLDFPTSISRKTATRNVARNLQHFPQCR